MTGGRIDAERPDGPISGTLYDFSQQLVAVRTHAAAEGHAVGARTVLESYDRTIHPWMHGRRPADLAARARSWWRSLCGHQEAETHVRD